MTSNLHKQTEVMKVQDCPGINLPTGATVEITHIGNKKLNPELTLKRVRVVCSKLSAQLIICPKKLIKNENCEVQFKPGQ